MRVSSSAAVCWKAGRVARLVVAVCVPGGGVGDAPVDGLGIAGKLGADLAHPIAQADHPIEPLLGETLKCFER
jgi:hypothetical protein